MEPNENKKNFAARLNSLLDAKGYRVRGRATDLNKALGFGLSDKAVKKWLDGDSIPTTDKLKTIAKHLNSTVEGLFSEYPDSHHIITNNGEYLGLMEPWGSYPELPEEEVELPFFTEVELAAGNGMINTQEIQGLKLRFARSTLKGHGVDASHAVCVKVSGNSMDPVLPDGSTIGVDTAKTDVVDGKMFAIDHDGMLRIKVLYKVPGGGIRLKSFNSDEYPDETYNKTETQLIRIIGKVFWYSVLI